MSTEIVKAEDFGLEESTANDLTKGLEIVKSERELLISEFKEVSQLELTEENIPKFRELRLKIVKNRTQGINKWHKKTKEFFLSGGKFVDSIKNKESDINEQMEEKLIEAEKYFENLEKERLAKLQKERVSVLSEYLEDAHERILSDMDEDVWQAYLETKKKLHLERIQAELDAEKERQAKIDAEKKEQERIRKENAKLKAEAEERERLEKIEAKKRLDAEKERLAKEESERKKREAKEKKEREEYEAKIKSERESKEKVEREERLKREKLEAELQAKIDAEAKAKAEEEERLQAELNKGDSDKVIDLLNDIESLKTKYTFKSEKNKKMYDSVSILMDKVKNHINSY